MNCVHCDGAVTNKDYWYYTDRFPIHTACIGYADDALLAKLFRAHNESHAVTSWAKTAEDIPQSVLDAL